MVTSPDDIRLTCDAYVDGRQHVKYEWLRDIGQGHELIDVDTSADTPATDGDNEGSPVIEDGGRRLIIRRSKVGDTGEYVCRASTDVDSDQLRIAVTVRGLTIVHFHFIINSLHVFIHPSVNSFASFYRVPSHDQIRHLERHYTATQYDNIILI